MLHKKGRVLHPTKSTEFGAVTFEFRPFGVASRLLSWLRYEKEYRRQREASTLKSPYDPKAR